MREYIIQAIAPETIATFEAHNAHEIIRCKDCKHQDPDRFNDGSDNYVCRKGHGWKPDDWFCADGKRKE